MGSGEMGDGGCADAAGTKGVNNVRGFGTLHYCNYEQLDIAEYDLQTF
jgi:hypothetical protein